MATINAIDSNIPIQIALGGTNATTLATTDGVVYFDGTRLVTTAVGTATQVLTSNGAGLAPTFQAAGGGGGVTSITGTTGGAQTGALTLAGGTTGLAYGGSTGTITSTFAGITANGGVVNLGTDNAANAINIGVGTTARAIHIGDSAAAHLITLGSATGVAATTIKSGSGNIAMNSGLTVDSLGKNYNTAQPSFLARLSANTATDKTGDGTLYQVICDTVLYDQTSSYNNSTGTFTAPITGKYLLVWNVCFFNMNASHTTFIPQITTTLQQYNTFLLNFLTVNVYAETSLPGSTVALMNAGDTAVFKIYVGGSTKTVGIVGGPAFATDFPTWCSATLIC